MMPASAGVLLRLGRVSNLPTTWTNVAAGVYLGGADPAPVTVVALCMAISLFYVGGMYLNDAFDREIDARERPERPIPAGLISARAVLGAGFGMLFAGLALVVGLALAHDLGPGPGIAATALGGAIVLYDLHHKQNPLSPLLMGLCRVLVYVVAALGAGGELTASLGLGAGALLCYLIGLTYVAKQENLRELRGLWPLLFLAVPFGYHAAWRVPAAIVLYLLLAAWIAYTLSFLLRKAARNIPRAVGQFIAGIALLDGMLVAAQGQVGAAGLCVAAFVATLLLQRVVPGT